MKNISYHEYWSEVKRISEDTLDAINNRETLDPYEWITQEVNGHQWIIYTAYHDGILNFTYNSGVYLDMFTNRDLGDLVADKGLDHARMIQAYEAFRSDVMEMLEDDKKEFIKGLEDDLEMYKAELEEIEDDLSSEYEVVENKIEDIEEVLDVLV